MLMSYENEEPNNFTFQASLKRFLSYSAWFENTTTEIPVKRVQNNQLIQISIGRAPKFENS